MRPEDVITELERLATELLNAGYVVDANKFIIHGSGTERMVTWSASAALSNLLGSAFSLSTYVELIGQRNYSLLLFDGSLLQISYNFSRDQVVKHRLYYCPCPLLFDPEELKTFGLQDLLETTPSLVPHDKVKLDGTVRFDFDQRATKPGHPSSHLTVSGADCRIPVTAPLSVGHFVRFVFSQFYPECWNKIEPLRIWPTTRMTATITDDERKALYVHLGDGA